ncbi:MAG: hypothetical protein H6Q38_2503, partial [Chloroflexi bacterium]|nr:hypothetical protein [Chloroflexota bacterium]
KDKVASLKAIAGRGKLLVDPLPEPLAKLLAG